MDLTIVFVQIQNPTVFISSSGIEQESLPTVSSSVGATRIRHTQV
jgi:hypothetical protein